MHGPMAAAALWSRRQLRDEFRSGRLEKAPKKAQALQALCDGLGYDPEAAVSVHKGIFIERIESFLNEKKKITSKILPIADNLPAHMASWFYLIDGCRRTRHMEAEAMDACAISLHRVQFD